MRRTVRGQVNRNELDEAVKIISKISHLILTKVGLEEMIRS